MGELKLPPVADSDRLKTEGHCQTLRGILPEDLQLGGSPVQGSHDGRIAGGDVPKACCQSVGVPHLRSWWGLRPMLNCRCQSLQKAEGVTVEYLAMSWGCLTPRWGDQAPHPPFLSPQGSRGPKGYKVRCQRGTAGGDTALWGCNLTFV